MADMSGFHPHHIHPWAPIPWKAIQLFLEEAPRKLLERLAEENTNSSVRQTEECGDFLCFVDYIIFIDIN